MDEGRVEVVLQVLEILEPDRHAEQTGRDPGGQQLGLGRLAMRGRRRVDDHRVDAPERGGQLGQAEGVDDRPAGLAAALDLEGEHAAGDPRPELPERDVMLRVAVEARVEDRAHAVVTLEPGRQCRGRRGVALDPQGEGQDPAQDEERLERTERRPGIDLGALDARDPLGRAGDHAGDDVAVAAQELGRRFDHEIRAEVERAADVGRGERVVDHVCRAVAVGQLGERGVVGQVGRRVGDGLGVQDAGRGRGEGRGHRVEVGRVDDVDPHPEAAEHPVELGAGRAIRRDRRDDPVAGPHERGERGVDRAHPRGEGGARRAAGQLGIGAAEGARGRVRDPAVGEAGPGVGGDPAELLGIGRGERRGLVDGHARRRLIDGRRPRRGPDGAGREALGAGRWPRVGVAHGSDATPESAGRPARGTGTPVTRSLPARFEAYIAPSALMISSSALRPSSG